jgi:hypothetical protein
MLTELTNVQQTGGRRRRWFRSEREDLIVWFSDDGSLWGFQFCYDRDRKERALTWRPGYGFSHERIDDGEGPGLDYKRTPILVADGMFDAARVLNTFLSASEALPEFIVDFVAELIRRYPNVDA